MDLDAAISAVQAAETGLNGADGGLTTAQARADGANAALVQAKLDDAVAVEAFNGALDALAAAAAAAKRPA